MSDAEAKALEASLPVDDISSLADCTPVVGLFDASTLAIRTATGAAGCRSLEAGPRFKAAWMAVQATAVALWARGTSLPVEGPLRVSASPGAPPGSPAAYAWPSITLPLGSFVLGSSDLYRFGVSRIVDDADSAKRLRALRDQYLDDRTAQPGLYVNWDGLAVTDKSTQAFVYMRDAVPYEDAGGRLQF